MRSRSRLRELPGRALVPLSLLALGLACTPDAPQPAESRPNIVLIIGDDHGYQDFGFMGSSVALTPNLDQLAAAGTLFRFGYSTASVCRPALLSLLTGLQPTQLFSPLRPAGGRHWSLDLRLRTDMSRLETLPRLLGSGGYASLMAGKYWEGDAELAGFSLARPSAREVTQPAYEFMDAHPQQPFFLWLSPTLPHVPHDAPERFVALYEGVELAEAERRYLANVAWFDATVGQLIESLEARGLRERTLVVFVVDNGWRASGSRGGKLTPDGPRGKGSLYEMGVRTPVILSWPGTIPAGQTQDALISVVDIFPTLLDYAEVALPPDTPGRSLRPIVQGDSDAVREVVVGHMPGAEGDPSGGSFLRTRRWYFIDFAEAEDELYDMDADPEQTRDLAAEHPELVGRLRAEASAWRGPPPPE